MESKGKRLLTVKQFCEEYSWPTESALRSIILAADWDENNFKESFVRVGRRVLINEELFWNIIKSNDNVKKKPKYSPTLPIYQPSFEELSKHMRINQEIIMKEISNHVDKELKRFQNELSKINKN